MTPTSRKKRIVFKLVTILISSSICAGALSGAEVYLHYKHGINFHGYRGPSLATKRPGEKRVAILGGSTTWGFGVPAGQDFPAQLQQMLSQSNNPNSPPITIANLGANNDGAYSFKFTLNDYDYLDCDAVIFYSGYNDLSLNNYVFRHRSQLFAWTGYMPLLPTYTVDKLTVWKRQLLRQNQQTIFQPPNLGQNKSSPQTVNQTATTTPSDQSQDGTCLAKWKFYCDQIYEAAAMTLKKGKRIMIVTEPYLNDAHVGQQQALANMLAARFAGNSSVHYLNLGTTLDLRDPSLCWDGMHLTAEGNRRIAAAMAHPVLDLLR